MVLEQRTNAEEPLKSISFIQNKTIALHLMH